MSENEIYLYFLYIGKIQKKSILNISLKFKLTKPVLLGTYYVLYYVHREILPIKILMTRLKI